MIVLVCGGRNFNDILLMDKVLGQIHAETPIELVIEGDATGADTMAGNWAYLRGIHVARVAAMWKFKNAAGPMRNRAMLKLKPDLVIAFPGGNGTSDMIAAAKKAGVPVMEVTA